MTDIVKRLYDFDNHGNTASDRFLMRKEAGEEIERLRAENMTLRNMLVAVPYGVGESAIIPRDLWEKLAANGQSTDQPKNDPELHELHDVWRGR